MLEVGIDLSGAAPRLLTDELARQASLLVTMGCGEACPVVPGLRREDWPLEDPKGKPPELVRSIRDDIQARVRAAADPRGHRPARCARPSPSPSSAATAADLPAIAGAAGPLPAAHRGSGGRGDTPPCPTSSSPAKATAWWAASASRSTAPFGLRPLAGRRPRPPPRRPGHAALGAPAPARRRPEPHAPVPADHHRRTAVRPLGLPAPGPRGRARPHKSDGGVPGAVPGLRRLHAAARSSAAQGPLGRSRQIGWQIRLAGVFGDVDVAVGWVVGDVQRDR